MSRFLFILACGLALAGGAFSQTADDPEDFARLH